ncbi:hypothetical protein ACOJUR_01270 [Alicyclobacillus tolerans]|uniref:hypothetical protein n=1 Tax=Alicyclobacillus tolerans TaxID=90970 RepID=UPI003B7F2BD8
MSKAPTRVLPTAKDKHFELWSRVRQSLAALPSYFASETNIEGLRATDIHTLNTTLGATIEEQVVASLNKMRAVWDPDDKYSLHSFIRQTQTFPDVLFAKRDPDTAQLSDIILGIELKGWYVLAKEGEPSFRYQVTPAVCTLMDMVVIVPWYLSNVISGVPRVLKPYIEAAKYAAEYRNYWWQNLREAKSDVRIESPTSVSPYPKKSDKISDKPKSDGGGNFGRYARTGIMDDYIKALDQEEVTGIAIQYWREFFKLFQQDEDQARIRSALERLRVKVQKEKDADVESLSTLWREIGELLGIN